MCSKRNWITVIGLLVIASIALVACAPAATPQVIKETVQVEKVVKETVQVERVAVVTATPAPPTPKPTGPQHGGVLRIATATDENFMGVPWEFPSSIDWQMERPCLERLVEFDKDGKPIPWLATSWDIAKDLSSITFKLREGVKFHDGTDFNAEAAKWNLDNSLQSDATRLPGVSSIDVIDDHTIRLNLSAFNNTLLGSLATYNMMASPTAYKTNGDAWSRQHCVGTGPFKFVSWQRDVKQVYQRFDGYWQSGKPYLDGIEWDIIADPLVTMASLLAGNVDMAINMQPKDVAALTSVGDFNTTAVATQWGALMPSSANPKSPWADVKVREAAGYAIDTQTIADKLFYGYAEASGQIRARNNPWYNPDVKGQPYDPAKAKQLLTEAGYPDGFKTDIYVQSAPAILGDVATSVQGYWSKVGINATVNRVDSGRWREIFNGGWEGVLYAHSRQAGNDLDLEMSTLWSPGGATFLPSIDKQKELGTLAQESMAATDYQTKLEKSRELMSLFQDKYVLANPVVNPLAVAVSYKKVHDSGIFGFPSEPAWRPAEAWIDK